LGCLQSLSKIINPPDKTHILVQQAYSGGYEHPIEVGGAVFTPLVLSPYGGWHGGCGNEQRGQAGRRIQEMMRRSSRETGLGVELRRQVSEHVQTAQVYLVSAGNWPTARRVPAET
jgi:hypothetical protein